VLDIDGFNYLLDLLGQFLWWWWCYNADYRLRCSLINQSYSYPLEPFASDDDDSEDVSDADSGKASSLTSTSSSDSSSSSSSSATIQQGSSTVVGAVKTTRPLEDKDDHELLEGAFKGLSNGKSYVSVKDILDWDFVYTLIAEVSELWI
jgi:hypothetical protein